MLFCGKKTRRNSILKIACNLSNQTHYGNKVIDEYTGEVICNNCGVVLEEKTVSHEINEEEVIDF